MIFIIDHCYASNHPEECIIIKNKNLTIEEMTRLVGSLACFYNSCTNKEICPPREILDVLCKNIGCKDRKHKFVHEMKFIEQRLSSPMLYTAFVMNGEIVIWIDIKEAMNYCRDNAKNYLDIRDYIMEEQLMQIKKEWNRRVENIA